MSTIAVVLIVIGAVIVIALVAAALKRTRDRQLEDRRQIAGEHREEAEPASARSRKKAEALTSKPRGHAGMRLRPSRDRAPLSANGNGPWPCRACC